MSMKMLDVAGSMAFAGWIRGLLSAGISGGASAITGGIVVSNIDPEHYNFQAEKFWVLTGTLFMVNALVSIAKYLQANPIPQLTTTKTTEVTEQAGTKPKIVTTVSTVEKDKVE